MKRYKIGEVAKITGLSISRLRYYDKIGILCPRWRDDSSEYRQYDVTQLETAFLISAYQDYGFSLKQIQLLLESPTSFFESFEKISEERLEDIDKQINRLSRIKQKLISMRKDNIQLLKAYKKNTYTIARREASSYLLTDDLTDISQSNHYQKSVEHVIELHMLDRSLPWYLSSESYQCSISNTLTGQKLKGYFAVEFSVPSKLKSTLKLCQVTSPYCIRFMGHFQNDNIHFHLEHMIEEARKEGYEKDGDYFYLDEIVIGKSDNEYESVRQIRIPLIKVKKADKGGNGK